MKPQTLILLSLLLVACLGYVVVRQIRNHVTDLPVTGPLFGRTFDGFSHIRIEHREGTSLEFERLGNQWYIRQPLDSRADDVAVMQLENVLGTLSLVRALSADEIASEPTGLDTPEWKVQAIALDGTPIAFDIGKAAPRVGTGQPETYVRHYLDGRQGKDRICVVARDFTPLLSRPANIYRHRRPMEGLTPENVRSITFSGQRAWTLTRQNGRWMVETPSFSAPAMAERIDPILRILRDLYVQEFVTNDDLASLGLTPENAQLVVTIAGQRNGQLVERTLTLGNSVSDARWVYADLSGQTEVLLVGGDIVDKLQIAPDELRDRRVMRFDPDQVRQVQLDTPNMTIDLMRDAGRWQMTEPLAGLAEDRAVMELLARLVTMTARDFLDTDDPESLGLDQPKGTVTMSLGDSGELVTLEWGNTGPDGAVFARSSQSDTMFTIDPMSFQPLLAGMETYYDHTLINVPTHNVTRLVLSRPDGTTITVAQRDDGSWEMLGTDRGEAEPSVVEAILRSIAPLRAQTIASWTEDVPHWYLDRGNTIVLTITTETLSPDTDSVDPMRTQTHTLRVVRPGAGSDVYAWRPGRRPVIIGQIDPSVYDALMTPVASRRLWDVPADAITEIHVTEGLEEPFVLQKVDGRWTDPADPYARINTAEVSAFIESMRRVKASRYLNDSTDHPDLFDLTTPWITLELVDSEGDVRELRIASSGPGEGTSERYAMATGTEVIILISSETLRDIAKDADDFVRP